MYQPANATEQRALELLGVANLSQERVASILGVDPSRISQLMAQEDFRAAVQEKRFEKATHHSTADAKLDEVESKLLTKVEKLLPMMHKPGDVFRAFQIINSAKRRSAEIDAEVNTPSKIVHLQLPVNIINKFTVDSTNKVIAIDEQTLVPIQSSRVAQMAQERHEFTPKIEFEPEQIIEQTRASPSKQKFNSPRYAISAEDL